MTPDTDRSSHVVALQLEAFMDPGRARNGGGLSLTTDAVNPAAVNPNDPEIVATVEAIFDKAVAAAGAVDAEGVLVRVDA